MTKAVFLILNDLDLYDEIMELYYDLHVGATTIDSQGMGKTLMQHDEDFPIFSSLRKLMAENKPYNRTIMSVVHDDETCSELVDKLEEIINMRPGVGFMFVMPVVSCHGYKANAKEESSAS
ncbi:MAG: hypothetical protein N4A40_05880 [Tissierellales bacterium]|jgi:nitrogen regulatory protein PII|nr:hypothetical protein [Tissierellales bacterium]